MQSHFQKPSFLLDPCRPLFVDVDSSKQYGHGAILYHVLGDPKVTTIVKDGKAAQFPKTAIQPILFLSKRLSIPESHYWPTELEVAGLVWVLERLGIFSGRDKKLPPSLQIIQLQRLLLIRLVYQLLARSALTLD